MATTTLTPRSRTTLSESPTWGCGGEGWGRVSLLHVPRVPPLPFCFPQPSTSGGLAAEDAVADIRYDAELEHDEDDVGDENIIVVGIDSCHPTSPSSFLLPTLFLFPPVSSPLHCTSSFRAGQLTPVRRRARRREAAYRQGREAK